MTERIEAEAKGRVKIRIHLGGSLQISPSNITGAVADGEWHRTIGRRTANRVGRATIDVGLDNGKTASLTIAPRS